MSIFAIRNPYFIIVVCLIVAVIGGTSFTRLPVDMFPPITIPVVVVATFYPGMPAEQIEAGISGRFERFFTLAGGVEHIESRSLSGVSLIKVYFQPGVDPDAAVTNISNLAMAQLRRLPPGTLPPVVLKFDASSLPVCLVTVKGNLNETVMRDMAQITIRNQIANVRGASVPQPFGGKYRQMMIYVDPQRLEAYQMSAMDVVRAVNDSNLILPAGSAKIGPFDYNLFTNSLISGLADINAIPIKTFGNALVRVGDVGYTKDDAQIQYNVVRTDGQRSAYLVVLKQGGSSNTIEVVDGIRKAVGKLTDVPKEIETSVVFDQANFIKEAVETLIHEGAIGLVLTSLLILVFLGSLRATFAVFLSIPLSTLAAFICLWAGGGTINTMVLGGLALAFSRLIDNSVVVLENIYRHLEMGKDVAIAAADGGREVALPVLAATLTTSIVFFPVIFLYGVSKFLFEALALAVVLSLLASYIVAMTVVPLYCANLLKPGSAHHSTTGFNGLFNRVFHAGLDFYSFCLDKVLRVPALTVFVLMAVCAGCMLLYPKLGLAFFPRTDAGMFSINLKAPTGTRIEKTEELIARAEKIIKDTIPPEELDKIVSNIGVTPDFSAIYTSNAGPHMAFVQVALKQEHKTGTYEYMDRIRARLQQELPQTTSFFQSGSMVDAVLNLGLPAPIDLQVSGTQLKLNYEIATGLAAKIRDLEDVKDVYIPQDMDYPALRIDVNRAQAGLLGIDQREAISNVITALASNSMIAPGIWIDPRNGYDYLLTVQYPEKLIDSVENINSIPVRSKGGTLRSRLDSFTQVKRTEAPSEVDHYGLRRTIDVFVSVKGEDLGRTAAAIDKMIAELTIPQGVQVDMRGMVLGMRTSFKSFFMGLGLSLVLLYLVIVAQFKSFRDPILILLAVPPGLSGVVLTLYFTGTTLNVQSLMGVIMMVGIVVSDSILIVEFSHRLREQGVPVRKAVEEAARARLRPVLMTTFATLIGLMPMALKLGTGSEAYAPLARAIVGGQSVSLVTTIFIVPAAFLLMYGRAGSVSK